MSNSLSGTKSAMETGPRQVATVSTTQCSLSTLAWVATVTPSLRDNCWNLAPTTTCKQRSINVSFLFCCMMMNAGWLAISHILQKSFF